MRKWSVASFVAILALTTAVRTGNAIQSRESLIGVWLTKTVEPDAGPPVTSPQPGVLIFSRGFYSLQQVEGNRRRPSLPANYRTGDAQSILAVYGSPFTAHTGRYSISGDVIEMSPIVAKRTDQMASNYVVSFSYELNGGSLTLRQRPNASERNPRRVVYTFSRAE